MSTLRKIAVAGALSAALALSSAPGAAAATCTGTTGTTYSNTITDTGWHHVAATKAGATVHLYIDGADVTGTVTNRTMANNPLALSLGQSSGGSFWNGTLDEVALYRAALTASQVKSHYDTGAVTPSPTPSPSDPVIAAAGDIPCDPSDPGYNGGARTRDRSPQPA